jgi:hypothetical protein
MHKKSNVEENVADNRRSQMNRTANDTYEVKNANVAKMQILPLTPKTLQKRHRLQQHQLLHR